MIYLSTYFNKGISAKDAVKSELIKLQEVKEQ
jgi:hypothetical protein